MLNGIETKEGGDGDLHRKLTPAELADLGLLAWQTRATRQLGKGERELCFQFVELLPVEAVLATVHLVPHYGGWKDMFELLARPLGDPRRLAAPLAGGRQLPRAGPK